MGNLRAVFITTLASAILLQICLVHASFSDNCYISWGANRAQMTSANSVELRLNKFGGSGITSKVNYMYGAITAQIKLVPGNSAGTVTTFYLSSSGPKHDEIDFEFLGNVTGQPYTIHTNIYTQGFGKREQQFKPWFNPTDGYHNYTIFWNPYAVVWFVDQVPIRVFRNYHDTQINFPDSQLMKAFASLWDAEDWATQGGRVKTDWSLAPFVASFQNYNPDACTCPNQNSIGKCTSHNPANWYTNPIYSKLRPAQLDQMNKIRANNMFYNYCNDEARFKGQFPKECSKPQY